IQNWRCNLYYLNLAYLIARSAPFIIQLLPICYQMRHEVLNLQSIYLLKMYRNPFTHFLIAGEAHAKCRCCVILAILPFMTFFIFFPIYYSNFASYQNCTLFFALTFLEVFLV